MIVFPCIQKRRSFKFFNFWLQNPSFKDTLIQSWAEPVIGRPMFVLSTKLKRLKSVLRKLNLECYSNISKRVYAAKEELDVIQEQLFKTPFDLVLSNTEKEILNKYVELRIAEESFLKQKSRVKWLALGDQNSKYFHQKMCSHRARNTILSLTDSSGCLIDDPEAVKQEILGYYVGLLGTAFDRKVDALPTLNLAIQSKVPVHFRFQLIAPVT
ncbi:hypothetical protein RHGRI_008653 [Rhododendron griersonianum]|uniref:Uncharacterized protein n=1 Tax=Rhododendron griersonianum TaxID=479676 RepID=A0AAV6L336_9ERIC|nr:hypothetical protein RHGRI_008653 [Rhododendron griersonianum]